MSEQRQSSKVHRQVKDNLEFWRKASDSNSNRQKKEKVILKETVGQ